MEHIADLISLFEKKIFDSLLYKRNVVICTIK